jgi:hypothetical protein
MRALSFDAIGLSPWYYGGFMAWPSTTCAAGRGMLQQAWRIQNSK